MIKFVDVIKANKRYWYVIISSVLVVFSLVFGLTYKSNSYNAKATILVEKRPEVTGGIYITQEYVNSIISEVTMRINHEDFAKKILAEVNIHDKELANELSVNDIKHSLSVKHTFNEYFFEVSINYPILEKAKTIADSTVIVICNEYNAQPNTLAQLTKVYSTELSMNTDKSIVYGLLGVVMGILVGEIIITCILVFNPYVESKELLQRQAGTNVIASLKKVKGDKNERK